MAAPGGYRHGIGVETSAHPFLNGYLEAEYHAASSTLIALAQYVAPIFPLIHRPNLSISTPERASKWLESIAKSIGLQHVRGL